MSVVKEKNRSWAKVPSPWAPKKAVAFVGGGGTIDEREEHPDQEIGGNRAQDGLLIDNRPPHEVTDHRDGRDQIEQAADRWQESGGGVVMEEQGEDGRHDGDEETDGGNDSDQVGCSRDPENDRDGGDLYDDDDRWPPGQRQD